ncbi:MAG TPA: hypothetical protein DEP48_06150 [Persephonella sp.]|nr:hypothetical protein [Persephonella sp.]
MFDLKNLIKFYKSIYHKSQEEVLDIFPVEMELPNSKLISVDILNRRYNHMIVWKVKKYD